MMQTVSKFPAFFIDLIFECSECCKHLNCHYILTNVHKGTFDVCIHLKRCTKQKAQIFFTNLFHRLKHLDELDNNGTKTAQELGVERNNIYTWIKQQDSIMG